MNKPQKFILITALALFFWTLAEAPWEIERAFHHTGSPPHFVGYTERTVRTWRAPIWESPYAGYGGQARLQVEVLLIEWIGIAVIGLPLFLVFRTRKPTSATPKSDQP